MSSNTKQATSEKMKLAPIRSLADFLLDAKKYRLPPFDNLKRFNNRVTSNLLYYQTNYFAISAVIFSLFLLFRFNRLLGGAIGIAITCAVALFSMDRLPQARSIRAQYPLAVYGAWAVNAVILYTTIRPIMFFALVVLIPFLGWILHASVRGRGLKNKVNNKMEQMGAPVYTNTPMGIALVSLGLEARDFEE